MSPMAVWLLARLGGVLRAAGLPLWGSLGPLRGAVPAPAAHGGSRHSLLWVLWQLFSLPIGKNGGTGGAARTPRKGWAGGRRMPSGGSEAQGSCRAALLSPGSTGILQDHLMSGLPTAPAPDSLNQLVVKAPRVPAQGCLQQLDHGFLIQAKEVQAGQDKPLCR